MTSVWLLTLLTMTSLRHTQSRDAYLLPPTVRPRHYDVRVLYDIDPATNFSFFGYVNIAFTVEQTTSKIVLHSQDHRIADKLISVTSHTAKQSPVVTQVTYTPAHHFVNIQLDRPLVVGAQHILNIPFYGNLAPGLEGVYISTYSDLGSNHTNYLIATQFEAIAARQGFPCFDEPSLKATFRITLGHHKDFSAVSNMPLEDSCGLDRSQPRLSWLEAQFASLNKQKLSFVWDTFRTSVPMSTYLVAFVVSQFEHVTSPPGLSEVQFRIWARKDVIKQAKYASTAGPKLLTHFTKYFGTPYPLPKQDMVAIPDFDGGGMENWGLILFRENSLLYDEESSLISKEYIMQVISHELAHQWFGNLVTMKWWSDLWLNEGFAMYIGIAGLGAIEPSWRSTEYHALENLLALLGLDSLASSHPVSVTLQSPEQVNEIFDTISYMKGASLIRMLSLVLGVKAFRKGLDRYLVKYSYKNAAKDDLWAELTIASKTDGQPGVHVKEIMDNWITETGYPIVTVERNYGDNTMMLKQQRYLNLGVQAPTNVSWWIPVSVLSEGQAVGRPSASRSRLQWLARNQGVYNPKRFKHSSSPTQWVLLNYDLPNCSAPYRVNYDSRNWELLITTLNSAHYASIPLLGRVGLLSDAFALAWTGRLDYSVALRLANYMDRETELLPLHAALSELDNIYQVFKRSEQELFNKFVRKIVTKQYHKAGGLSVGKIVNKDDLNQVKAQVLTSYWACETDVPGCRSNAEALYSRWLTSVDTGAANPISPDLRGIVFCRGVAHFGPSAFEKSLQLLPNASIAARKDLMTAMACVKDRDTLLSYLSLAISGGSVVRSQDADAVFASIARTLDGFPVVRDFVYQRIKDIDRAFGKGQTRLGSVVCALLKNFSTQREIDEFLAWQSKHDSVLKSSGLQIAQCVEAARVTVQWARCNFRYVAEMLQKIT